MEYLLSGIQRHLDKGFGITADAYYKSAEHLMNNRFENDVTQQAEMPQNFLFRHSIELYLKSLIIIFHKKLEINYGSVSFDNDDPEIFIDNQWKKLYTCHYIDRLYNYWLNNLLLPNVNTLKNLAPEGVWQETKEISELFSTICKYDQDSSYFRYPITKNNSLDERKYSMQKFKGDSIDELTTEIKKDSRLTGKGGLTLLIVDDNDKVIEAFRHQANILSDVRDALKEVAFYFFCLHTMTRATLCKGL